MRTLLEASKLIHAAEFLSTKKQKSKRLTSIITDVFFERTISQHPSLGISKTTSSGWVTCKSEDDYTRNWYKLASNHDKNGRQLCLQFMRKILLLGGENKFYLVHANISPTGIPQYNIQQLELDPITNKIGSKSRKDLDSRINKTVSSKFAPSKIKKYIKSTNRFEIEQWLINGSFSLQQLESILTTRVFLNFSGIYGLTDIDLICLIDGQISIVEFKRKYPAYGNRYILCSTPICYSSLLSIDVLDLNNVLTLCHYQSAKDTQIPGAYGLDKSHLKVLADVGSGINYRYVIWDTHVKSLAGLLAHSLSLKKAATIKYLDLELSSFYGATSTPPESSSSFDESKSRTQLLMLESVFSAFSIP